MKTFIIGCGSIGLRHAKNLKQLGYTIDYIFDIDNDKASKISDKFHAIKIKNTIEGMKKSDVVFICAPPDTHTKYIKQAIKMLIKLRTVKNILGEIISSGRSIINGR